VHRWDKGWVQDFSGGAYDKSIIMHQDGTQKAYVVGGPIWSAYCANDGMARIGYPVGDERRVGDRRIQYFERGAIKEIATDRFEIVDEELPTGPASVRTLRPSEPSMMQRVSALFGVAGEGA
jgi:hypothetical protein